MTSSRRFAIKKVAACALLASAGGLLAACQPDKPQFKAIDITGADYAQGFQLTDFNGRPRSLADYKGKVVVVFFGFTQCPDVCPTTMNEMAQVKKLLGTDGDKLQVVFISIDPERDTPEVLKAYMGSFDPSFAGLYAASPDALAALAKDFKIYYKKVDGKTPTSYTMDHSAGSYVYDTAGRLRVYNRYGSGAQALGADVRALLQEAG